MLKKRRARIEKFVEFLSVGIDGRSATEFRTSSYSQQKCSAGAEEIKAKHAVVPGNFRRG